MRKCLACEGTGWDWSDKARVLPKHCPVCLGSGQVEEQGICRGGYLCACPGHVHAGEVARPAIVPGLRGEA